MSKNQRPPWFCPRRWCYRCCSLRHSRVWGVDAGEEADDLRLFRRAALEAASAREAEAAGPPKAAFLFLTNSDLTFAPL